MFSVKLQTDQRNGPIERVDLTKTHDLMLWRCNHTGKFPRNHRFVLVDWIERNLEDRELLIRAKAMSSGAENNRSDNRCAHWLIGIGVGGLVTLGSRGEPPTEKPNASGADQLRGKQSRPANLLDRK